MPNKILLVDDDPEFREEFKACFEEYPIIDVANGESALKILEQPNDIDLVMLDVKMPGISGIEVLKKLKAISPDLGIIILTGSASREVIIEALKGHADDYLEKPLNVEVVKEIIEKVLENKRGLNDINSSDTKGKIEKVKDFIERNCFKKTMLTDAAGIIYLSPKYLSRIFKQNTGESFSRYRLKIKIEKAKEFLLKTGYNVNQIAEKLAYENTESLIREFKKITGFTPTKYRKKKISTSSRLSGPKLYFSDTTNKHTAGAKSTRRTANNKILV
ncbi:MAG: response regulator [Elusimicrobiota bacterium]